MRASGYGIAAAWLTVVLLAGPSLAQSFLTRDLTTLSPSTAGLTGGTFSVAATAPGRLTFYCQGCPNLTAVDVLLGRDADDTEGRYRAGSVSIAALREQCQARNATCTLDAATANGAVGWRTVYKLDQTWGSTTVLFKGSDKLTVRSIAPDAETAEANGKAALQAIGAALIGEEAE